MREKKASQQIIKVAITRTADKLPMSLDSAARRTEMMIQGSLRSKMKKMMRKDDQAA